MKRVGGYFAAYLNFSIFGIVKMGNEEKNEERKSIIKKWNDRSSSNNKIERL